MRFTLILGLVWMLASMSNALSQAPQQEEQEEEEGWPHPHFYWSHGLHIDDFLGLDLSFGGDAQNDSAVFANTESIEEVLHTPVDSGVEWRRARAYVSGRYGASIEFLFRYDFAVSSPPSLQDAYIGFKRIPFVSKVPFLRTLRIFAGRFKAPLGIDGSMSSNDTPLMEYALTSAFLPSRNTGLEVPRVDLLVRLLVRCHQVDFERGGGMPLERGRVTVAEAAKITGTSRNTIKDHLKALTRAGHLERHGAGRGTWYALAGPEAERKRNDQRSLR